jgi:hypothetical protein
VKIRNIITTYICPVPVPWHDCHHVEDTMSEVTSEFAWELPVWTQPVVKLTTDNFVLIMMLCLLKLKTSELRDTSPFLMLSPADPDAKESLCSHCQ